MNKMHMSLDDGHFAMEWPTVNSYDDTCDILEVLKILAKRFKRKKPYRIVSVGVCGIELNCRLPRKRGPK